MPMEFEIVLPLCVRTGTPDKDKRVIAHCSLLLRLGSQTDVLSGKSDVRTDVRQGSAKDSAL